MKVINCRIYFEKRDMWIGVYWKKWRVTLDLYICLIPCFPILIVLEVKDEN